MNPQNVKPAAKQPAQKREVSPSRKNPRLSSKSNLSSAKPKPEIPSSSKFTSGPSPPDIPSKLCRGRPRENPYLDLMELAPRDPGNQASQGVQDFIKQVSKFIEKKNPFKVTPQNQSSLDPVKSENQLRNPMLRNDSRIFGFDKNKAYSKLKKNAEKSNAMSEKIRGSNTSADNGVQRRSSNSMQEAGKTGDPRAIRTNSKKDLRIQPSLKNMSLRNGFDGWDFEESPKISPNVRKSPVKRAGRSEIPLRKVRRDMSRNPKAVSLLLRKPLKEAESAISIDFCSKKPFTPIEELSLCSEIQSNNVTTSSENLNYVGIKSSPRTPLLEEVSNGFKLERCLKNPNIPVTSDPSCTDMTDQKLTLPKRSKILNLDKVRTSSFTVLQNSREALCRLESLHQQNVSTKESVFGEKFTSSKLKMLAPKTSFNSLKKKSSKKNLGTRLSSKGNKPGLKVKTKKSKSDIQESSKMPKQQQNANVSCYGPAAWNDEEFVFGEAAERDSRSMFSFDKEILAGMELSMPVQGIPDMEFEELEKELRTSRKSVQKSGIHFEDGGLEEKKSIDEMECPPAPPHTPELVIESGSLEERQTDDDERSSSKTVILGRQLMDEVLSLSSEDSQTQFPPARQTSSKSCEMSVKGTQLKFAKDEPPEKPEGSEPKKNKLQIKINLNTPEDTDCEENAGSSQSLDRLYLNSSKHSVEQPLHEGGSSEIGDEKEETKTPRIASPYLPSEDSTAKEQFIPAHQKTRKSAPFLRNRLQYKVSGANLKGMRKKKVRSDAGDRRLPSSTGFFKSISLKNKIKLDTKLRSGLTKAYTREEKRDLFDDSVPIKLKRRNSEPISFRGYIWKRADSVIPRGHKTSVSSMASSLKHLNTDDIDDFIFWEAVPQKMTSCWEMSLYHFKRPWSVLSCSVFEDNRQSSTPGLILENLRNGGSLSQRRSALNSNESPNRSKENPFDVEPSIAQKNIDIRNWLAALNFPTPPSTSIDIISEGNFSTQPSIDTQNLIKGQVGQKRRKVPASLRFSEEAVDKKADEKETKYKKSPKWNAKEVGGLMQLIQRKSGSFVTNEQFLNSEHSIHRPNLTVNLCLYSKPPEDKPLLRETNNRNVRSEPKTFKSRDNSPPPQVEKPTVPEPGHKNAVADLRPVPKTAAGVPAEQFHLGRLLKGGVAPLPSDLNIWKYLFLFTLFIISIHYYFLNNGVGRG